MFFCILKLLTAATESPPPTKENAPFCVLSEMYLPNSLVPFQKLENSKTPKGPFHRMVFEFKTTSLNFNNDFGPASIPS